MSLGEVSRAMAEAAEAGRWDDVSRSLWRRADLLDGPQGGDEAALREAHAAGERVRLAAKRQRAEIETELQNLRAARRSAGAWRPYREPAGGSVDLTS